MNLSASNKSPHKRGQSFVEMAMVLPVVLMLVLGGVEYTNLYVLSLRALSISREASNMAFRRCRDLNKGQMDKCLDDVLKEIDATIDHVLPNFHGSHAVEHAGSCDKVITVMVKNGTVILTAWKVGFVQRRVGDYLDTQPVPPGKTDYPDLYRKPFMWSQRFIGGSRNSLIPPADQLTNPNAVNPFQRDYSMLNTFFYKKGGYMFVAEVFYKYDPITGFIMNMADSDHKLLPDELYQAGFF